MLERCSTVIWHWRNSWKCWLLLHFEMSISSHGYMYFNGNFPEIIFGELHTVFYWLKLCGIWIGPVSSQTNKGCQLHLADPASATERCLTQAVRKRRNGTWEDICNKLVWWLRLQLMNLTLADISNQGFHCLSPIWQQLCLLLGKIKRLDESKRCRMWRWWAEPPQSPGRVQVSRRQNKRFWQTPPPSTPIVQRRLMSHILVFTITATTGAVGSIHRP